MPINFLNRFSLEGKTALVTGASRGLGQAIAVGFASAGADIVCTSAQSGGCDKTLSAIREYGRQSWAYAADLADRKQITQLVENVKANHSRIDILVNNAGTIRRHPATEFPEKDWNDVIAVNLDSIFFLSQHLGADMVNRRSGKIINIASVLSFSGGILVPSYTASKHAVAGLTKALANEWAQYNVQVNAIAPGYFSTDNTQKLRDDPVRSKEILSRIPAQRWGEPNDLTGAAIYLASPASDYVNGHILTVDGGWMAR
jgi:2-dehydro-3-deoxy-D-gluconate 5-dehydrogenase